ncbi:hypothetical protein Tco_1492902 [Tanacetum coccineum]
MFNTTRLEIGIKRCSLSKCQKFNKWLRFRLLRNKEKLEEIAITNVNVMFRYHHETKSSRGNSKIRENSLSHVLYKNSKRDLLLFSDSGNDDSTLKKDLHEENFQENVEIKNSNVSDKPVFLNTPLSDQG